MLEQIKKGFSKGLVPKLTLEGTSGAYQLINDHKTPIALFKPEDEEPYAPENPRGFVGKMGQPGIRQGIRSGECAAREYLAYLLDPHDFHNVPPTFLVEVDHTFWQKKNPNRKKTGSMQLFIEHLESVANYGPKRFSL